MGPGEGEGGERRQGFSSLARLLVCWLVGWLVTELFSLFVG